MKHHTHISPQAYADMLEGLSNLFFTEKMGQELDLKFYRDDQWLSDTAVIERLAARAGAWDINLVFAHHKTPLKFMSRRITSHPTYAKAKIMANLMRRLAAKDQRGTLTVEVDVFKLLMN
jgi:hypothetical protein